MTFCDVLAHVSMRRCFKLLVTATVETAWCLYITMYVPASVHKFCSQPDCLAESRVFPAKEAGLFHDGSDVRTRHFCRRYLKSNKVSKNEGTGKVEHAYHFLKKC